MENKQSINNDEIDLREIATIIWKRKVFITLFVFVVCIVTVIVTLKMDNIYESKAVLRPTQDNANQMSSTLSSIGTLASFAGLSLGNGGSVSPYNSMSAISRDENFIYLFIKNNKFESQVVDKYEDIYNTDKYKDNPKYYIVKSFQNNFEFTEDTKTGLMTLNFKNKDRYFTKKITDALLVAISNRYKAIEMNNIQERINSYKNEIDKTNDIALKNKLSELVAGLIQNKVLSLAQEYYGFDILVNPDVSDSINNVSPRRGVICILTAFLSLLISIFCTLIFESVKNRK